MSESTSCARDSLDVASERQTAASILSDQLVMACWQGSLAVARTALASGASVNALGSTGTLRSHPLAVAVSRRRYNIAVELLARGADVNGELVMKQVA